jgi:nucleoside-diphosphate-sugar epimerase
VNVLVTVATGYTGSGIADALGAAGHRVSGLARSDQSARKLEDGDIWAVRGAITDAWSLREAIRGAETVVHAALMHGEGAEEAEEAERSVVVAVLDVLWGTRRTFVYNSGVWFMGDAPEGVDLADEETTVDPRCSSGGWGSRSGCSARHERRGCVRSWSGRGSPTAGAMVGW